MAEAIKWLLAFGADPNQKNKKGDTPLHYTMKVLSKGKAKIILKMLIQAGGDIDIENNKYKTPLDVAEDLGLKEEVQGVLASTGPEPDILRRWKKECLAYQTRIESRSPRSRAQLLSRSGSRQSISAGRKASSRSYQRIATSRSEDSKAVKTSNSRIRSVTSMMSLMSENTAFEGRLSSRSRISARSNRSGNAKRLNKMMTMVPLSSVLENLALSSSRESPELNDGNNVRHIRAQGVWRQLMTYFASAKHNLDEKEFIKLLLENEDLMVDGYLNLNRPTFKSGSAMLHAAVHYGKFEIVRVLLAVIEVNVNLQNNRGDSPLHIAAERCHKPRMVGVIKLLLDFKADKLLKNNDGDLPHQKAKDKWVRSFIKKYPKLPEDIEKKFIETESELESYFVNSNIMSKQMSSTKGEINELWSYLVPRGKDPKSKDVFITVESMTKALSVMLPQSRRIEPLIPDMFKLPVEDINMEKGISYEEFQRIIKICERPINFDDAPEKPMDMHSCALHMWEEAKKQDEEESKHVQDR
ncbi:hypothetical protein AAMO2058_001247100 [Amorphochlora amoebiformis]